MSAETMDVQDALDAAWAQAQMDEAQRLLSEDPDYLNWLDSLPKDTYENSCEILDELCDCPGR